MQRLKLTQDFGLGHRGDEVVLAVGEDSLTIEHHEFDPGDLFPWAVEISYDDVEAVALQAPWGPVLRLPATRDALSVGAVLALGFRPAVRRRLGSGLMLTGAPEALAAAHSALEGRCSPMQVTSKTNGEGQPLGPDELEWFDRLVYGSRRTPEAQAALCAAQQRAKTGRWSSSRRTLTERIAKLHPQPVEEYIRFMD